MIQNTNLSRQNDNRSYPVMMSKLAFCGMVGVLTILQVTAALSSDCSSQNLSTRSIHQISPGRISNVKGTFSCSAKDAKSPLACDAIATKAESSLSFQERKQAIQCASAKDEEECLRSVILAGTKKIGAEPFIAHGSGILKNTKKVWRIFSDRLKPDTINRKDLYNGFVKANQILCEKTRRSVGFRTTPMMIIDGEYIVEVLKDAGMPPSDIDKLIKNMHEGLLSGEVTLRTFKSLGGPIYDLIQSATTIPIPPEQVAAEFDQFIDTLHQQLHQQLQWRDPLLWIDQFCPIELSVADPNTVNLAAWAHQEIIRIHPFSDGNGRIARIVMNSILERSGIMPVFFPDKRPYTDAAKKIDDHSYFLTFLKQTLEKQYADCGQPFSFEDSIS